MAAATTLKQEFLGAVTLVSYSSNGSLLYIGVGSTIFLYTATTCEFVGNHDVLTRGILHGFDLVQLPASYATTESFAGAFFGQKRVACFQNLPQTPSAARSLKKLAVLGKPKVFCDWVFDVQMLTDDVSVTSNETLLAAVGLAHNLVQIWNPICNTILRSVQCAERCILYALAFHGRSLHKLVVASGTVFQQILLWNPTEHNKMVTDSAVEPRQRLHAHDGVLLKLTWSSDARSLASVSDDRTVQLWAHNGEMSVEQLHDIRLSNCKEMLAKEYSPVFRAWGHSARIWDVAFWERGVATASEDGLCKLWDLRGNCVATLQGHIGRNVWRVAVHPSLRIVATGGGDGAVKFWDVTRQLMSSSSALGSSDSCKTVRIPISAPSTLLTNRAISSNSVRNIVLSTLDNGKTAFVASEHGKVFRLDLSSLTSELIFGIARIDDANVQAKTSGLSTFTLDYSGRFLLLGETSGLVRIVAASTGTLLYTWTTQTNVRVMKIWWNQKDAAFISSANGVLSEYEPLLTKDRGNLPLVSISMKRVATVQIPAKSSPSSLLLVDCKSTRNVIVGDGHGSIYAFHRSLESTGSDNSFEVMQPPAQELKRVHKRELVASLLLAKKHDNAETTRHLLMFSGGHDGYICTYVLDANAFGALTVQWVGRESIRGISTVKRLWWNKASFAHSTTTPDLMVFGFHATQAILHNFSARYRIFNVECGGWRRPHALITETSASGSALPSHTFVFTPPAIQKDQVDIKVHSTLLHEVVFNETVPHFAKCSLHDHYHGRMTTCVAFLGQDRLLTAAEDNSLMLHRRRACGSQKKSARLRWVSVATGIAHTTTVRALTTFQRRNSDGIEEHIVLSGGGKQRLNVWLVREQSDLLRLVCGHDRLEAAQDHRILGLATFTIPSASNTYRLVAACNSEGSTQLLLLNVDHEKLIEVGECQSVSRKPLLSCVGFQNGANDALIAGLAVGSTDGVVTLWDMSALLKEILVLLRSNEDTMHFKTKLHHVITGLQPSGNYFAHEMGVNCINLVSCDKSSDQDSLDVSLISGGDDQSLYLHKLCFPSCRMLFQTRTENASGAAIKSVVCADVNVVFAAGYDQRVSKWHICRNQEGAELAWQGAVVSECADIADLAVRQAPTGMAYDVVIVGQGLQMVQFLHV